MKKEGSARAIPPGAGNDCIIVKNCFKKKVISFLFVLAVAACSQPIVDTKAEGEKVMQLSRQWSDAASSGNVEKTLRYWADDAVVISAGQPPAKGKEAIRQMVTESYKMPGFRIRWQPKSVVVSEGGDMAYLLEDSQVFFTASTGQPVTVHNKAVSIWRKQPDGVWKNTVHMSTTVANANQ